VRRGLIVALAALALVAVPATAASAACRQRANLADVESQVMCLVCGVPLGLADSPQASRERDFINGLIDRCESTQQIKAALVAQYGPRVLALPKDSGFNVAAYLVPFLALLFGGGIAATAVRWWASGRHAGPPEPALPAPSRADARRLDAEMASFER
jgi:cytochrome c-type biogenesis protein CcmH/NrfF